MLLKELFDYETGNLSALDLTEEGTIPLVYGSTKNNGVVKLVSVDKKTKVFKAPLITVSYLGTAFVQTLDFTTSVVDKSNVTVLIPKKRMKLDELYYYCYQINRIGKFGYNYGRRMNQRQLNKIKLQSYSTSIMDIDIKNMLPKIEDKTIAANLEPIFALFPIDRFFKVEKGSGDYRENYEKGATPLVSATTFNNGIVDYVNAEPKFKKNTITVERIKGTAFVQLMDYLTVPDDISVLKPINKMTLEELFFFAYLIRKETWRYSYGRKLSVTRLKKLQFELPVTDKGDPDYKLIQIICRSVYGWKFISEF